jgi:hypothetical protein
MRNLEPSKTAQLEGDHFSRPAIRARLRALAEARRTRRHPALA